MTEHTPTQNWNGNNSTTTSSRGKKSGNLKGGQAGAARQARKERISQGKDLGLPAQRSKHYYVLHPHIAALVLLDWDRRSITLDRRMAQATRHLSAYLDWGTRVSFLPSFLSILLLFWINTMTLGFEFASEREIMLFIGKKPKGRSIMIPNCDEFASSRRVRLTWTYECLQAHFKPPCHTPATPWPAFIIAMVVPSFYTPLHPRCSAFPPLVKEYSSVGRVLSPHRLAPRWLHP